MDAGTWFRINRPKVIAEDFTGEVVLINLETGTYYSIDSVGSEIWKRIENGATSEAIAVAVAGLYAGDPEAMSESVRRFITKLLDEGLIIPENGRAADPGPVAGKTNLETPLLERAEFRPPVLNRYTDMQDLLLLDPIHEVDESGWPVAKPEPPGRDD